MKPLHGLSAAWRPTTARSRGTILIVTMWIVLVLTGLVLVLSRAIRVEAVCSANETSALQAEAIEEGAIQYVRANVDSLQGKVPTDAEMPCEAVPVGQGAFWIIRPNFDDDHTQAYGIVDEASKINLNTASQGVLSALPDITDELAASIIDWRDSDEDVTPNGAESQYYLLLPQPYQCKNGALETVEELFLVNGATKEVIFGEDTNRNGRLDTNEDDADATEPQDNNDGRLDYGLFPFVTVYSAEPNTSADGQNRININDPAGRGALNSLLQANIGSSRAATVMDTIRRARPPVFRNVLDFYLRSGLAIDEFRKIADKLTTASGSSARGLVNVNTAPAKVLACLPGLTDSDVSALVSKRDGSGVDLTNIAWVAEVLQPQTAIGIGGLITARAYRFSADIVSISGDGRAFRRCRVIIDAQSSPPKVIHRQDLTHLGWPLAPDILTKIQSGASLDDVVATKTLRTEVSR